MKISRSLTSLAFILLLSGAFAQGRKSAEITARDVVIYGGTSAGVAAAIQLARLGKSVVIIEPGKRVGGMTTHGLGQTDIGNKQVIGGISREFYQNIKKHYASPANWTRQDPAEYRDGGQTRTAEGEDAMWTFEPSAAQRVYEAMLEDHNVEVVYGRRLDRSRGGTAMKGTRIHTIATESGEKYSAEVFIDATYEGDLMAAAGVSYTVGREPNSLYGETLNGIQAGKHGTTLRGGRSNNSVHHNFVRGVDPYTVKGDSASGLLPFIAEGGAGTDGEGDDGVQAYCFRMTLTDHPENRIPFAKPEGYRDLDYELLFRNYEAAEGPIEKMYWYGDPLVPWINSEMPNRKTDTNNQKGFSTDFIGQNYAYPDGSYAEREAIVDAHRRYQQGLMWTLAYHPRTPEKVRDAVSKWGICKDEFTDNGGWPEALYVREARRMVSDYVMTQHHCEGKTVVSDPVGMAAYGMDSHHVKRYVDENGHVRNEGNVEASVPGPYPVSYQSIVPKDDECTNLIVPVCLSASHIAFGSIRMEPVFMILGQSAAMIAAMAIDTERDVQALDYAVLKRELTEVGQILE